MRRWLACLAFVLLLPLGPHAHSVRPELARHWLAHDPESVETIDHQLWEQFLLRYVRIGADDVHRVAYGSVAPSDRMALDRYIGQLAALPILTYNRNEQMAYWINLYNALLVRLVLEHYPIASVLDIDTGPGRSGPWKLKLVTIDSHALSLSDIENRILRPIWHDPRVHYALSCAAMSCPDLQPVPFDGQRLNEQLTDAAMDYVNDPRCVQLDGDRLVVSSLFRWYREDFGGSDRGVIRHLMAFAKPRLAMRMQDFDGISGDVFDWRLNDARAR